MKKKWTENRPYYYSKDSGIDDLAVKIVEHIKEIHPYANPTLPENLERAAESYLENNLTNDNLMIFTRPIVLGHTSTEEERVRHWIGEAIKAILRILNNKETKRYIKIVDRSINEGGVGVYKDNTGTLILKGTLSPHTLTLSPLDYGKLNNMIKEEIGVDIKDMDFQQFYQIQNDIRMNFHIFRKEIPSLRFEVFPDNLENRVINNVKLDKKRFPSFQKMMNDRGERERVKKMSSTMSVFDGI